VVAEDDDALGLSVRAPALSTGHSLTIAREGPRVDPNQKAGDGYRLRFINLSSPVPDEVAVMVWLGRVGTLADAGVVGGDDGSISGRDSGVIGGADGGQPGPGPGGGGETKSGCGCSAGGAQGGGAWAAAGLVLALLLRRRRGR
jgi:MYXO-CTERM domain-containing protein